MREIGSLPKTVDPLIFGDYLSCQGVTSRIIETSSGWTIWIHDEDYLTEASEALKAYLSNPNEDRFGSASKRTRLLRQQHSSIALTSKRIISKVLSGKLALSFRHRPLTTVTIALSITIYLAGEISSKLNVVLWDCFAFFPLDALTDPTNLGGGLAAILRGEIWRLATPMFLHVDLPHLIFNMWATVVESSVIEDVRGTRSLAGLILATAVFSNLGQFLYSANIEGVLQLWGGYSGVLYGLFGYIWMKSVFEPEAGLSISQPAVRMMLLWLILGFTRIMPMANGAHATGLIVGIILGLAGHK